MKALICALPIVIAALLTGCASIDNHYQQIHIDSQPEKARCLLSNDDGLWHVTTPGDVKVHRSGKPLNIDCTKAHYPEKDLKISSHLRASEATNLLMGGIVFGAIGSGVDMLNGSAKSPPSKHR
jgi:hypothetical protein